MNCDAMAMITDRTPMYDRNAKYDRPEESDWHKIANPSVERFLKKHNAKTVLDLACGTGGQVFWLAKHGYNVVGADISKGRIRCARIKAKRETMEITFLNGDMRTIKVGKFDAVITMYNAVGHLTKAGFEKAMRNVRDNLNQGGIYIFDIINSNLENELNLDVDNTKKRADGAMAHKIQTCRINRKTGVLTMNEAVCLWKVNGDLTVEGPIRWTMQVYNAKQLKDMLSRNGFRVIGQYSLDGSRLLDRRSTEILTVARKI